MWRQRYPRFKVIIKSIPHVCNVIIPILFGWSLFIFFVSLNLYLNMRSNIYEFNLITLNSLEYNYVIILDSVSSLFISVVLFIASSVTYFRKDYIAGDPNISRFMWVVFIFVVSIMALVLSPNIIRILLGWDGLGLVSYILVIYYQNFKSFNAGILTALTNRLGDVLILISIALARSIGSFNFMRYNYNFESSDWLVLSIFIAVAACTKSAQIPFSAWLPAAMAAPTPVSALVHSSTLVTAGVYLLIRFYKPLLEMGLTKPLLIVAIITMFIAGISANFEMDMKKIIALSTLRQLGLIITAIGLGLPKIAYFHILSHALFKALLFICAGNVIHASLDNQDLRKIGFITNQIPVTSACINTANLALCGAPFLAGFYSKDLILEIINYINMPHVVLTISILATALTISYSLRISYYTFISNTTYPPSFNTNDTGKFSTPALIPLTLLSIVGGASIIWIIFPTPILAILNLIDKILILFVLGFGLGLMTCTILFTNNTLMLTTNKPNWIVFMGNMWFLPTLSCKSFNNNILTIGHTLTYTLDRGWAEITSVKIIYNLINKNSKYIGGLQTTNIKFFLITFLIWFTGIIIFNIICLNSLIEQSSEETWVNNIFFRHLRTEDICATKRHYFNKLHK